MKGVDNDSGANWAQVAGCQSLNPRRPRSPGALLSLACLLEQDLHAASP